MHDAGWPYTGGMLVKHFTSVLPTKDPPVRARILPLLAGLALALAACGGGDADQATESAADAVPAAEEGAVTFVGTDNLQWQETSRSATLVDGSLDVTIVCEGGVPHNVLFEGVEDDRVIAECAGDDSGTGTVDLEPGTYTYYCAIPGHREAGMVGELTVS